MDSVKILIHYTALNRGGAELSIVRLLSALVRRGCEVHLVLTVPGGELEDAIDPAVTVHHLRARRLVEPGGQSGFRRRAAMLKRFLDLLHGRFHESLARRKFRGMQFDAAFVGRAGMPYGFVCDTVMARTRCVFVRSDPSAGQNHRWAEPIERHGRKVDYYVCVSHFVQKEMAKRFPQLASKLTTIYNLIEPDRMRDLATHGVNPFGGNTKGLRVLSVCRLQEAPKALLRMVEVHRRLLDAGLAHVWHVLGDGPDRAMLEQAIADEGVSDTFKLHGAIANPFPYYRHADICAVLSRYEGLCGVVNEARVLERPVIATRFSGIEEQIEDGVNGLIVEQDVDAIIEGMATLMRDAGLRQRLASGGYPVELLDDDGKLDRLIALIRSGVQRLP